MKHWSEWEPLVDALRRVGRDKEADALIVRGYENGTLRTEDGWQDSDSHLQAIADTPTKEELE